MAISGKKQPFIASFIRKAPDQPGVYALFNEMYLIYYGSSKSSVKNQLMHHFYGDLGFCTEWATHFIVEICSNTERREAELMLEHRRIKLRKPRCNDGSNGK